MVYFVPSYVVVNLTLSNLKNKRCSDRNCEFTESKGILDFPGVPIKHRIQLACGRPNQLFAASTFEDWYLFWSFFPTLIQLTPVSRYYLTPKTCVLGKHSTV